MADRFEIIFKKALGMGFGKEVQIIIDNSTGVNYLFVKNNYGAGLTPLLDADGKPVITNITTSKWNKII
ncbi:MAG: xylan 1,4-beta-xylosidase [Ruminococcus sp.]|nr:xylan 1,4-beta-xylosidase [Ruminococcus sp.]